MCQKVVDSVSRLGPQTLSLSGTGVVVAERRGGCRTRGGWEVEGTVRERDRLGSMYTFRFQREGPGGLTFRRSKVNGSVFVALSDHYF